MTQVFRRLGKNSLEGGFGNKRYDNTMNEGWPMVPDVINGDSGISKSVLAGSL